MNPSLKDLLLDKNIQTLAVKDFINSDGKFDKTVASTVVNSNKHLHINFSQDPYSHISELRFNINDIVSWIQTSLTNYSILTDNAKLFFNKNVNTFYYPWFLFQTAEKITNDVALNTAQVNKRSYKLSCLNRLAKEHRVVNYFKILESQYPNVLVTLHNMYYGAKPDFYHSEFENICRSLPTTCPNDHTIIHEAYTNSYVNLITETDVGTSNIFLSEKTFKPIFAGQFFLMLGNPGAMSFLKDIGIDTFDDIFDHGYYDNELNLNIRINKMHEIIKQTINLDFERLYQQTVARRLENVNLMFSQEFKDKFVKPIYDHIANSIKA